MDTCWPPTSAVTVSLAAADSDRMPYGERNSSESNSRSRIRRSRSGSSSDSSIRRPPGPERDSSGPTSSGRRRCSQRSRDVTSGTSSAIQDGTSVAPRIGSSPTIDRTRMCWALPSGLTSTS